MRRWYPLIIGLVVVLTGLAWLFRADATHPIDSYARCLAAGNPVTETDPPVCQAENHNFIGPRSTPVPVQPPIASHIFSLLVHGDSHGNYPDRQEVIRNDADWRRYWRQVHAGLSSMPPVIPVNFSTDMVIAASYGPKPTAGYDIKISGIATSETGTTVDVVQTIPGEGCTVMAAKTNPYFIARAATLPDPVYFRVTVQKHDCPR